MIAAAGHPAEAVVEQLHAASDAAGPTGRVGVNFLLPFLDEGALDVASTAAAVVECFYGDPDLSIVRRIHDGGALAAWQVGSLEEARAAVDVGCDVVVVQGVEAGGHVRGTTPLWHLVDQVRSAIDAPLVAGGGIGSGAAMAEAMLAGADAVRIGTRFLATSEADVHAGYRDALIAATAHDTVLTETFSMGWRQAPHRVLRQCVDASPLDPTQRSPLPPTRAFEGEVASAALYAGESVGDVLAVLPAAEVVRELVRDAEAVMRGATVDRGAPSSRG